MTNRLKILPEKSKEIVDQKKPIVLGDYIGGGSEYNVFALGQEGHVIKVPKAWWHTKEAYDVQADLCELQENAVPILDTEVLENQPVQSGNEVWTPPYVIVQKRSNLPTLDATHLQIECIRAQLSKLLQISVNLFKDKNVAIDFLGAEAMVGLMKYFISPSYPLHVHNFHLNHNAEILLLDTGLLNPEKCKPFLRWGISEIINLQHYLIEGVVQTLDDDFKLENFDPSILVRFTGFSMLTATSIWSGFKRD